MASKHIFNAKSVCTLRCRCPQASSSVLTPCILPGMAFLGMMLEGSSGESHVCSCLFLQYFRTPEKPVSYKTILRQSENVASRVSNVKAPSAQEYEACGSGKATWEMEKSTPLCEPDFLYKVIFAKVNSFLTSWTPLCSNLHLFISQRFN